MDPRHESREQEILNQIIALINDTLREDVDLVLQDNHLKMIAAEIYAYAEIPVGLEAIFARHNLLSVDVVYLPHIDELIPHTMETHQQNFAKLIAKIKEIIKDKNDNFCNKIRIILT